jgi:hypothetical protein
MRKRTRVFQALAILLMAVAAELTAPPAARGDEEEAGGLIGGCVWCRTSCPANLVSWCTSKCGYGGPGSSCVHSTCTGRSGQEYDYTINCT